VSQDPGRKIIAVVGMEGSRDKGLGSSPRNILYGQFGGSRERAGFKYQPLFQLRHSPIVIAGDSKDDYEKLSLVLRRTRVTARPAFWRESMNEVNASPVSRLR